MKVVIVGGVAGGASAAARIRRLDEQAQIVLFERTGYISYANCGLPYYIGGIISDEEELTLQTPESFWDRFRVDVRVRHEVTAVNPEKKTVTVRELDSGVVYEESYDKLILSPGAKPVQPDMPGYPHERIFTLRTVEDTLKIKKFTDEKKPRTATVIGGGFIGLEMAENLAQRGIQVTIVEYADHLLAPLDFDMACSVHVQMKSHGIRLMLKTAVTGFEWQDEQLLVKTADGCGVPSDMVLLAIGVAPDTALAKSAGLKLGIKGSILVNDRMETSVPDIYAVGDAVEVKHFITGRSALISLAGPANKQGRIAADNVCGGNSSYKGSQGSSVIKLFDMTVAATGINEGQAKMANIDYERIVLSPASHASYYPDGRVMTMKVLYEKETEKILGAQIVGFEGADKRIDVIAAAIRAGMKAAELAELDLAYAPPYSSAKDPVNMAGFMIENIVTGKVKQFHHDEMSGLPLDGSVFLLDTRTPGEYRKGHAEGFINIPLDDLRERLGEIPKGQKVYVMCQSGLRSYLACRILSQSGYDCYNFSGGYRFYDVVMRGSKQAEATYACGMPK
ncbi:MAG: FAD-dependent oxidoreductase [Candidatus Merdivicinus sp.]|jgi:NADPH-dependent 2,4-dienoyl-CoA reductase/sulfur reductase-like enzyme/rhodanese-related sulfurtransferase